MGKYDFATLLKSHFGMGFRIPFPKNTSEGLLLLIMTKVSEEGPILAENNTNNKNKTKKPRKIYQ